MRMMRVDYFHVWSSEVVARLCRLRIDFLALVSNFDYVLAHTRFMGSHKLNSFNCHQVG
jgi:hypothetical protein